MNANIQQLLAHCIEEGISNALRNSDTFTPQEAHALELRIDHEIWCQLDTYFTFTNNNDD